MEIAQEDGSSWLGVDLKSEGVNQNVAGKIQAGRRFLRSLGLTRSEEGPHIALVLDSGTTPGTE